MSVNLGRVAYVEKGKYKSDTTYERKDVVSFNGGSYVYIGDTPAANVPPTDEVHWQPLIDPTAMNEKIAEMDGVKQEALAAAATAREKAQEATAAAEAANTAAEAADEARLSIADELNKKAPAIPVDASGDIVTITDGAEGMPVQALTTSIAPAADGSGWDSVIVTCTGKNLFGGETLADRFQSVMNLARDDEARTISFYANSASGKVFFTDFKPDTQYTIILYGSNGTAVTNLYIRYTDGSGDTPKFAASGEASYAVLVTDAGKSVEALRGSYSSGRTTLYYDRCGIFEGVLTEADFAEYQGKTLTAALPETVTEGVYDWVNGVLTKPDGSTVQLTPQQVDTLKGVNNIWSNAGETTVTYAADTKLYIDKKIAAIAAAIV